MPGSGLVTMIDQRRAVDLSRMYTLFLKVPQDAGKDALRFALRADIEDRGKAINDAANEPELGPSTNGGGEQAGMELDGGDVKGKGKAKPASSASAALTSALRWVQEVLDLKDVFDRILEESFVGDKAVQSSINHVCPIWIGLDTLHADSTGIPIVHQCQFSSTRVPIFVHRRSSEEGYQSCTFTYPLSVLAAGSRF